LSGRAPKPLLVAVGLGSNIRPEVHLPQALAMLRARTSPIALSQVWETPPAGGAQGPYFYNAVVLVRVPYSGRHLKQAVLRPIEAALGRERPAPPNAPRPIDLDVLVEGQQVVDPDVWVYPHWAVPLAEVLPGMRHPETGEPLAAVAQRLAKTADLRRVALPQWRLA